MDMNVKLYNVVVLCVCTSEIDVMLLDYTWNHDQVCSRVRCPCATSDNMITLIQVIQYVDKNIVLDYILSGNVYPIKHFVF